VCVCAHVYEPAEDTWLALEVVRELIGANRGASLELCIDVGSGTGVLGLECGSKNVPYTLLLDMNPCAAYCSRLNAKRRGVDGLLDVAQCDGLSCIRCPDRRFLVVYNTPYLPVDDGGLEGLAWSGGIREAERLARYAGSCPRLACIVLVYSSLSGSDKEVLKTLREAGVAVERRSLHIFFEDIVVVYGCRKRGLG